MEIGSEAFKACDELAKISLTQDNTELQIHDNAFMRCKQLNVFENMNNAKITYLGTGVFGDCRSMTNEFVNGVLENYATNGKMGTIGQRRFLLICFLAATDKMDMRINVLLPI